MVRTPIFRSCVLLAVILFAVASPLAVAASAAAAEPVAPLPPAPLTRVPNALNSFLPRLYPWRDWDRIDTSSGRLLAHYTLRLPEYAIFTEAKTAHGEDLNPLRDLPVEWVEPVRPAGAKGVLTGDKLIRVTNNSPIGTWISYEIANKQDTPNGSEKVGEPLEAHLRPTRIDVTSPEFPALYARLRRQLDLLQSFRPNSRRPSTWEGVARYAQQEVPIQIRMRAASGFFAEIKGMNLRVRVHSGSAPKFTLVPNEKSWDLAIVSEPADNLTEEAVFFLNERAKSTPLEMIKSVAERADQNDDTSLPVVPGARPEESRRLFQSLSIRPIDANTVTISALGLPETTFHRRK